MNSAGPFAVILPAAGKSTRFGGEVKKAFLPLLNRAVWAHSATLFAQRDDVCQLILVLAPEDREFFCERFASEVERLGVTLAMGGSERFESVANALALVAAESAYVAVHDAARPCLTQEMIEQVFAAARNTGAAILAVPVVDTVKRADAAGRIDTTVPRQGLWLAQTPQVFRRDWLVAAYARQVQPGTPGLTDDAQLVEADGHTVHIVPGSPANLKITTPADLLWAETILMTRRDSG